MWVPMMIVGGPHPDIKINERYRPLSYHQNVSLLLDACACLYSIHLIIFNVNYIFIITYTLAII